MISRKTTVVIADAYSWKFHRLERPGYGNSRQIVEREALYDFLYERDYEPWFCNAIRTNYDFRDLKEWIMQIHTGESFVKNTENWPWEKRRALGQTYLRNLARDFLVWFSSVRDPGTLRDYKALNDALARRLELDGYLFRDDQLSLAEGEVLDIEAETGLLHNLYHSIGLERESEAFEFLKLAEAHFLASRWSDCIGNARKFFELTMRQSTAKHASVKGKAITTDALDRPVSVRDYLEREGLLEKKEREAVDKIYGLLSHTGAHPYMAEKDQARLLRQISLTTAQFVLLRLEGALK